MLRLVVFNLLYVTCTLFALARGGAPERIGAFILIADFELSLFVVHPMAHRFIGIEWPMFAVDVLAFMAFYALSLGSTRFWPIWMAAIQGCVALSHLSGLRTTILPWAYGTVVAAWAYAMLAMLAIATLRHLGRLRLYQIDPAWPRQLAPSYRAGKPYESSIDQMSQTREH